MKLKPGDIFYMGSGSEQRICLVFLRSDGSISNLPLNDFMEGSWGEHELTEEYMRDNKMQ